MTLCVYHETTEAVATCPVCKQGICDKCLEYGQDGMCGMCLEMANARKATAEANRQSRMDAAGTPIAAVRPPSGPLPTGGPAAAPQRPAQSAKPGTMPPRQAPPAAKLTLRPGMCPEHPDKSASAACVHCKRKVCPFCLDLYDMCNVCRNLPHCARHESMVAADRCANCQMHYCRICLDGTEYCDRCRTLGHKSNPAKVSQKATTQSLGGKASGIGGLNEPKTGTGPQRPAAPAGAKASGGLNPARPPGATARKLPPVPPAAAKGAGMPKPLIGILAAVALGILVLFFSSGKPKLSPEEAVVVLQSEMKLVQAAAISYEKRNGSFPTTSEGLLDEMKKQNVDVDALALPLKLAVNREPDEPLMISYKVLDAGFEVRALDAEGAPLANNGQDVVMSGTSSKSPETPPE